MVTTGSFGDGDAACPVKIGRRGSLGRGSLRRLDKAIVARRRLSDASVVHHPTWTPSSRPRHQPWGRGDHPPDRSVLDIRAASRQRAQYRHVL